MNRTIRIVALLVMSISVAQAGSLQPQSIICDNLDDLEVLDMPIIKGHSGEEAMRRVKARIQINERMARMSSAFKDLAVQENRVMADARYGGSKAGEIADYQNAESNARGELAKLKRFETNCTMTGSQAEPAAILESKAIAGLVKVRTSVKGSQADVWTKSDFILDKKGI